MYTVYRIFCVKSGKSYIGSTARFRHRINQHKSLAKTGDKRPLYADIALKGWDQFAAQVLAEFEKKEDALLCEAEQIKEFSAHTKGYNITPNGDSGVLGRRPWNKGMKQLPHVIEAVRRATKGRKASPEERRKRSESMRGEKHHFYGKKLSPDHVKKLSESHKGIKQSEETKEKKRQAMLGKKYPIVECPHCGTSGAGAGMKRYHFDNCKMKD